MVLSLTAIFCFALSISDWLTILTLLSVPPLILPEAEALKLLLPSLGLV